MDVRFKLLEARCSPFAAEFLLHVKNHPQLTEILAELEKIDGQLFRSDIEAALSVLCRKQQ